MGAERRKLGKYAIITLIALSVIIALVSGCDNENKLNLTEYDKEYINKLHTFEEINKDKMNKYMYLYINHINSRISEEDLEFIRVNTEENLYNQKVRDLFFVESTESSEEREEREEIYEKQEKQNGNTSLEEIYFDGGPEGFKPEVDEFGNYVLDGIEILEIEEVPERSGLNIIEFYYIYRDNTYVSRYTDELGHGYVTYFRVEDDKVVGIYEL